MMQQKDQLGMLYILEVELRFPDFVTSLILGIS